MAALFAPTILVNSVSVAIKPNSFSYTEGFGERKVRVASGGGATLAQVISEDVETQLSTCKFMLYTTSENVKLIREWQANNEANVVQASDTKTNFNRTFSNAIITNDPDIALGVDGEVEVEFTSKKST